MQDSIFINFRVMLIIFSGQQIAREIKMRSLRNQSLKRCPWSIWAVALLCLALGMFVPDLAVADDAVKLGRMLKLQGSNLIPAEDSRYGFAINGSSYSGRDVMLSHQPEGDLRGAGLLTGMQDKFAELLDERRIHAMLIDGRYDIDNDLGTGLALRPYLGGGLGLAMIESKTTEIEQGRGRDTLAPMFRLTGGLALQLGADWDLSLNYKAGYVGSTGGAFTGRSQETVDLQSLDVGFRLKF
jgi:hypothetical protein